MTIPLHPLDNEVLQHLGKTLPRIIQFDYTNYKGVRAMRRVTPLTLTMCETEHHPGLQWILKAYDHDKEAERDFAVASIHSLQYNGKLISHEPLASSIDEKAAIVATTPLVFTNIDFYEGVRVSLAQSKNFELVISKLNDGEHDGKWMVFPVGAGRVVTNLSRAIKPGDFESVKEALILAYHDLLNANKTNTPTIG